MPMISRVRRWASQRSSQAKSMRARTRFTRAKVRSTIVAQGSRLGRAIPIPISIPSSHKAGHRRGRVQRTRDQADQKVRPVAQRETQKICGFDILGKCRRHQRKQLPKEKHRPEQSSEPVCISLREHKPGCPAEPHSAADAANHKGQADEDARGQFQPAAKGAQRIDKDPPTQFSDRRQLLSALYGARLSFARFHLFAILALLSHCLQPSQDNSWPSDRDPPTIRRKICSRVSFSPGEAPHRPEGPPTALPLPLAVPRANLEPPAARDE